MLIHLYGPRREHYVTSSFRMGVGVADITETWIHELLHEELMGTLEFNAMVRCNISYYFVFAGACKEGIIITMYVYKGNTQT